MLSLEEIDLVIVKNLIYLIKPAKISLKKELDWKVSNITISYIPGIEL